MEIKKRVVQKECAMTLNGDFLCRVSRYTGFQPVPGGVEVTAELTDRFNRSEVQGLQDLFDNYAGGKGASAALAQFRIRYVFVTPAILRVTTNLAEAVLPNRHEKEYFSLPAEQPAVTLTEKPGWLELTTSALCLRVYRATPDICQGRPPLDILSYELFDRDGRSVFREEVDEKSIYYGYFAPPLGRQKDARGDAWTVQSFRRTADEDLYGFGEQFTDFNKRGQVIDTWNSDSGNCSASLSYKNIPFFISTNGYGVLMGSDRHTVFDMGSRTQAAWTVKVHGPQLDYFVITGGTPREILRGYFSLTGKPGAVPRWSYGLWLSSIYGSADQVMDTVRKSRELGFPADVIHIDPPWMGLGNLLCNLEWSEKFGDHAAMIRVMREHGYKLCLYQTPYTPTNLPIFEEGATGGYFVKDKDGNVLINGGPMNFWSPEFAYIDYTNPEACRWVQGKVRKLLTEGCSVMKLDLCELYPEEAVYHNGMDGWEGHNAVVERYAKATYEVTQEVHGPEACVWRRSGGIGAARYPLHWAGDVKSSYEEMAGQLRAILGAGLSGFVFFSHDIGGFQGRSDEDLYIRWFQLGMFTSHARAHGGGPHEPWNKGERAARICKEFSLLRYSLLPHIDSHGLECCERGEPMQKALVLVAPQDKTVRNLCDEYLFTDEILAAPVLTPGTRRQVYLPEGTWVDWWDHREYAGRQWIEVDCPLERMPLYVRRGSIIVRTKPLMSVPEKYWEELILDVYPDGKDIEKTFYYAADKKAVLRFRDKDGRVEAAGLPVKFTVNIIRPEKG